MHDVIGVNLFLRKLRMILSLPHYLMESYNARETRSFTTFNDVN